MVRAFPALRRPLRQSLGATAGVTIPPDRSALRPISHGFDAILVSLILMRPLLGHDGLTDWPAGCQSPRHNVFRRWRGTAHSDWPGASVGEAPAGPGSTLRRRRRYRGGGEVAGVTDGVAHAPRLASMSWSHVFAWSISLAACSWCTFTCCSSHLSVGVMVSAYSGYLSR